MKMRSDQGVRQLLLERARVAQASRSGQSRPRGKIAQLRHRVARPPAQLIREDAVDLGHFAWIVWEHVAHDLTEAVRFDELSRKARPHVNAFLDCFGDTIGMRDLHDFRLSEGQEIPWRDSWRLLTQIHDELLALSPTSVVIGAQSGRPVFEDSVDLQAVRRRLDEQIRVTLELHSGWDLARDAWQALRWEGGADQKIYRWAWAAVELYMRDKADDRGYL